MKHLYVATAIVVAATTVGCGGGGAPDAPPTLGSFFIFEGQDSNSRHQVFIANMNGSGVRALTRDSHNFDPKLNHAGTRIAFASNRDGASRIYTMNVDGSDVRVISNDAAANDRQPTWSIDDSRIFFARGEGAHSNILAALATGGGISRLTSTTGTKRNPVASPDGVRVFYTQVVSGFSQIFTVHVANGVIVQLTSDQSNKQRPQFDQSGQGISWIETGSNSFKILTRNSIGQTITLFEAPFIHSFCWTPDGRRLIISSGPNVNSLDIANFVPANNTPPNVVITRAGSDVSPSAGGAA